MPPSQSASQSVPMTMKELRATLPAEIAAGNHCATCGAPAKVHQIRGGFCPWMPTYKAPTKNASHASA